MIGLMNGIRAVIFMISSLTGFMLAVQMGWLAGNEPGWFAVICAIVGNVIAMQLEGMLVFLSHMIALRVVEERAAAQTK